MGRHPQRKDSIERRGGPGLPGLRQQFVRSQGLVVPARNRVDEFTPATETSVSAGLPIGKPVEITAAVRSGEGVNFVSGASSRRARRPYGALLASFLLHAGLALAFWSMPTTERAGDHSSPIEVDLQLVEDIPAGDAPADALASKSTAVIDAPPMPENPANPLIIPTEASESAMEPVTTGADTTVDQMPTSEPVAPEPIAPAAAQSQSVEAPTPALTEPAPPHLAKPVSIATDAVLPEPQQPAPAQPDAPATAPVVAREDLARPVEASTVKPAAAAPSNPQKAETSKRPKQPQKPARASPVRTLSPAPASPVVPNHTAASVPAAGQDSTTHTAGVDNRKQAGSADTGAMIAWKTRVQAAVLRAKPAPEHEREGRAGVTFSVGRAGNLLGVSLSAPSGVPALDAAALAAVRRAAPFPPIPDGFDAPATLSVNIRFQIND